MIQQMNTKEQQWKQVILPLLPIPIRQALAGISGSIAGSLEEIRLRMERPLMVISNGKDYFLDGSGNACLTPSSAWIVTREDCQRFLENISDYSLYAIEDELRNGYITISGGFRVGIVGKAVMEGGRIKLLKYCSGFNIRINRQIFGAADKVIPYLFDKKGSVYHTLIVSPPQAGKTTMLRDIARQISNGWRDHRGMKIGIIDERSEIAGSYQGHPQNDVGVRTDVMDACPKAEGILMLIRAMSPDVIITDEIGKKDDIVAVEEALNAGVKIITSAHGTNLEELRKRPVMEEIISKKIFERYIILGNRLGVGTLEGILNGETFTNYINQPIR